MIIFVEKNLFRNGPTPDLTENSVTFSDVVLFIILENFCLYLADKRIFRIQ